MADLEIGRIASLARVGVAAEGLKLGLEKTFFARNGRKDEGIELSFAATYAAEALDALPREVRAGYLMAVGQEWKKLILAALKDWSALVEKQLASIDATVQARFAPLLAEVEHDAQKQKAVYARAAKHRRELAQAVEMAVKPHFQKACDHAVQKAHEAAARSYKPPKALKVEAKALKGWKFKVKMAVFALTVVVVTTGLLALFGVIPAAAALGVTLTYLIVKGLGSAATPIDAVITWREQFQQASRNAEKRLLHSAESLEAVLKDLRDMEAHRQELLRQCVAARLKLQDTRKQVLAAPDKSGLKTVAALVEKAARAEKALLAMEGLKDEDGAPVIAAVEKAKAVLDAAATRIDSAAFYENGKTLLGLLKELMDAAEAIPAG